MEIRRASSQWLPQRRNARCSCHIEQLAWRTPPPPVDPLSLVVLGLTHMEHSRGVHGASMFCYDEAAGLIFHAADRSHERILDDPNACKAIRSVLGVLPDAAVEWCCVLTPFDFCLERCACFKQRINKVPRERPDREVKFIFDRFRKAGEMAAAHSSGSLVLVDSGGFGSTTRTLQVRPFLPSLSPCAHVTTVPAAVAV